MQQNFMSMGEARHAYHHQSKKIERLERSNEELTSELRDILKKVLGSDPPTWYPDPGDLTKLTHLIGGLDVPIRFGQVEHRNTESRRRD